MLSVGLLVNPVAGMGGAVGLKGSDGADVQAEARRRGGLPRAAERVAAMFQAFPELGRSVHWVTAGGAMGASDLASAGVVGSQVYTPVGATSASDTAAAAQAMLQHKVDLILFCGGDGTARDLLDAVGVAVPVLGLPSGVKMHSGVFATSPRAAGEVLLRLKEGGLVASRLAEVRDVDESALRAGRTGARYYGELRVPELSGFVQHTKIGGREDDALALEELVQGAVDALQPVVPPLVFGPGGTVLAIQKALGAEGTLLGVDVLKQDGTWQLDVGSVVLERLTGAHLVLGFARGQGILIGRGNQQLSPAFLRQLDPASDITVVATRSKLTELGGRPLLLDTSDSTLDARWAGLWEVLVGYEERLLHRVTHA